MSESPGTERVSVAPYVLLAVGLGATLLVSDVRAERIALAVVGVLGVVWGLRARRQVEARREAGRAAAVLDAGHAALRLSGELFRDVAENITEVVWVTAGDGITLQYVSPSYEKVWGRPRDALFTDPRAWIEALHPDDRVRLLAEGADRPVGSYTDQYRIVRPDGVVRWIHMHAIPIRDASGACVRVLGTAADVTDLHESQAARQAQEALHKDAEHLRQAQKMETVGRLAGGVAHDFNNLLTVIGGFGHVALEMPELDPAVANCVRQMVHAGDRAAELTRQLLAFSRTQVLKPTVIDVNEVFEKLVPMLRRMIGEDVDLGLVLAADVGRVRADRGQIEQVVANLAINGRDAMPDGGALTLATRNVEIEASCDAGEAAIHPGRYVLFSVTDSGTGMSAETRVRVFEPFFTTKAVGKGTGLGLATSYGIVKQSGGHIAVYSELGHGTTFRVYLPRVDEAVSVTASVSADPAPTGSETVLLVEDDDGVRTFTAQILAGAGYFVVQAACGGDALVAAQAHCGSIDLVLTDTVMPGMNGRQFADRLRETRPGVNVLFMSGYTDDAIVRHGVLERDIEFMEKPFTPSSLLRKVRGVIDRHSRKAKEETAAVA